MTNYKLIIRYDGTGYRGWEHQPGEEKTIQGKMETAVIRMLNPSGVKENDGSPGDSLGSFEGDIPDIISAGRTDGGVDVDRPWELRAPRRAVPAGRWCHSAVPASSGTRS